MPSLLDSALHFVHTSSLTLHSSHFQLQVTFETSYALHIYIKINIVFVFKGYVNYYPICGSRLIWLVVDLLVMFGLLLLFVLLILLYIEIFC